MPRRTRSALDGSRRIASDAPNATDIYQQMLDEVGVSSHTSPGQERPPKRRRAGTGNGLTLRGSRSPSGESTAGARVGLDGDEEEEDDVIFEDVEIELPRPEVQTVEKDDDDEEDEEEDEDIEFEDVDFEAWMKGGDSGKEEQPAKGLELNLSAFKEAETITKKMTARRKPLTREEKERRVRMHQTHLLCLLYHVSRRNHWCNDGVVQSHVRKQLTDKMVTYLNPGAHLSQFGRTNSLKTGLEQVSTMWKTKFEITERGLRRSLWAEDPEDLQNYEPPEDMDSCMDREDFRQAAKTLQGSRDVGAQLLCALLRSAGARARLVCSLQPLACTSGAPTLPKRKKGKTNTKASTVSPTKKRLEYKTPKRIKESPHPVYWVEILDVGHQKWQPVDAVVTHSFWKPNRLEPPVTDKENTLSYVVAFDSDGTAKDVTRRYAKAYTAKTKRMRVEIASNGGEEWWWKCMKLYRGRIPSDLDQIEDNELAGAEAKEPMPRNIQDFKNHPIYALERHLGRHEVLTPGARPAGTVGAGSKGLLEKIYRRKDVQVARSVDKWYRQFGRTVKPNEIPAKWLPKRARPGPDKESMFQEKEEEDTMDQTQEVAGLPIYTVDQTELYLPPPVRNGRVSKNKYGNIDVYVPSMVPYGAVHIHHELAARAAFTLQVDYAPALTGFSFKGRHGTAVLCGVVVAREYEQAIMATIDGLESMEQEVEEHRRRMWALKHWRRFLMALRIRERVWSGATEDERRDAEFEAALEQEKEDESDVTEEFDMDFGGGDGEEDYGGGGFLVE